MSPLEASIVASILGYAATLPEAWFEKRHGSAYGSAGRPDITGCIRGRRVEVEVKQPGVGPTMRQRVELARWAKAGAVTGVVHSRDEFVALLRAEGLV